MCNALLGLHAFTGCDYASSFKELERQATKLLKSPTHCETLKQLGEQCEASDELLLGRESFTCAVFGKAKCKSVDEVHYIRLKFKCDGDVIV